ncbi:MAG: AMP-binding protein, partial [Proteobacteria bacterium]|nr:AMP-binding protein [Pseudomonadota bacterium]
MSKLLWEPSEERIANTNLKRFIDYVNEEHNQALSGYNQLYQWSIDNIPDFCSSFWDFSAIKASKPYDQVIDDLSKMPGAEWFSGARLNFAENLLRYRDDQLALVFNGEGQVSKRLTYAQLYDQVAKVAKSLKEAGVATGDRIVGFMPNMPETMIAMLAATSLGATWSSCSPDFGVKGVLDRFGQIKPKVIFTANGYFFKGNNVDSFDRIANILKELPSIEKVVVVPYTEQKPDISAISNAVYFEDFASSESGLEIEFEQLPFDHPLYIMFSSGT